MLRRTFLKTAAAVTGAAAVATLAVTPSLAETSWDVSIPWGPTEFHTLNAQKFAEEVKKATSGEVVMITHPGAALGIKRLIRK